MSAYPSHPKQLPRSKWTSAEGRFAYRHWEVVRVTGDVAELCATLDRTSTIEVPWRALRDRELWQAGWVSC